METTNVNATEQNPVQAAPTQATQKAPVRTVAKAPTQVQQKGKGEIKLAKKWFTLLIALSAMFLIMAITFFILTTSYNKKWQAANDGYNTVYAQCQELNTQVNDLQKQVNEAAFEQRVKDIEAEMAKTQAEEQRAYVKAYEEELQKLKIELALRGIETGDFTALNSIDADFAKKYENLKAQEAQAESDLTNAQNTEISTEQPDTSANSDNPWANMANALDN